MLKIDQILKDYANKNFFLKDPRELKSGKEAVVFQVFFKGKKLALKVYKPREDRAFQNDIIYVEGKYFRNPTERKAVLKRTKSGKSVIHKYWVRREFFLLNKVKKLGATVPEVLSYTKDSILMEFIGDEEIAPRLIDVELTIDEAKKVFNQICADLKIFLDCGIIHSDLSAYNILWWEEKAFIIDLPQAIDIRENPNKELLLERDLDNLIKYFSKYFEINKEKVKSDFLLSFPRD